MPKNPVSPVNRWRSAVTAILIAEASMEAVRSAKALSDIGGHYSRPDLLRLLVDRNSPERVAEHRGAAEVETRASLLTI